MKKTVCFAALLAAAGTLSAVPEAKDMAEALSIAAAENRTVLAEFTGRDWCPACVHLYDKVITSAEFDAAVGSEYVVMEIDYPRDPKLLEQIGPEEIARREKLLNSYDIEGMPTVLLMDSKGLPFAMVVGTRPDTAAYLKELEKARELRAKRDAAFAAAAPLQGLERAKALVAALELLPKACRDKYEDVIKEIIELDPGNTLGYKYMLGASERRVLQMQEYQDLGKGMDNIHANTAKNVPEALKRINKFLEREDLLPEVRQTALMDKSTMYVFLHDFDSVLKYAKEALAADPDSRRAAKLRKSIDYTENEVIPRIKAEAAAKKAGAAPAEQAPGK